MDDLTIGRWLFRKDVQQGRSKRRGEAYSPPYVEPLSAARTPLADFVNSLLGILIQGGHECAGRTSEQPPAHPGESTGCLTPCALLELWGEFNY
jgi:hypothetical protein